MVCSEGTRDQCNPSDDQKVNKIIMKMKMESCSLFLSLISKMTLGGGVKQIEFRK